MTVLITLSCLHRCVSTEAMKAARTNMLMIQGM